MGAHTTLPILGMEVAEFAKYAQGRAQRDFVVIVNESIRNECREPRQMVYFVDITDERTPFAVSNFDVPEQPGNFCSRGGRFGAHASNEYQHPAYDKRDRVHVVVQRRACARWTSATRTARRRSATTSRRSRQTTEALREDASGQRCKRAIQTNNVESTTAATSTSSIARTPGCTSSS